MPAPTPDPWLISSGAKIYKTLIVKMGRVRLLFQVQEAGGSLGVIGDSCGGGCCGDHGGLS